MNETSLKAEAFNLERKNIQLNDGWQMPDATLGTYDLNDEESIRSMTALLENGGRLIDRIAAEGWFSFGGRGHTKELFSDKVIIVIAENHHVSPHHVILRWNLQRNVVVISESGNPAHMQENPVIHAFELSGE